MSIFDLMSLDRDTYPQSVNVSITEKRAPTDESLRLLSEMKQRALEEVYQSIPLDNNIFKGIIYFQKDVLFDNKSIKIVFEWNGKRIVHDSKISSFEINYKNQEEIIEQIINELSRTIAVEILSQIITKDVMAFINEK